MNKKIEDLLYYTGVVAYGKLDAMDEYDREAIEQFAVLLVRECADVAADHEAFDIYEEIREHFGVEE